MNRHHLGNLGESSGGTRIGLATTSLLRLELLVGFQSDKIKIRHQFRLWIQLYD